MRTKIVKSMFLEKLPKYESGKYQGKINWKICDNYEVEFTYGDVKGSVKIINYDGKYLYVKYLDNDDFKIKRELFVNCSIGKLLGLHTSDFKIEIGTRFKDDKRNITIIDREIRPKYNKDGSLKQNQKWYKYHCNKDGYEGWRVESNLERGDGCSVCSNRNLVLGFNTIWDTDKWLIPIINDDEFCKTHTHSCSDNIYPMCPECGRKKSKKTSIYNIWRTHSIGCSCGDKIPYPEKLMFGVLEQLGLNFQTQLTKSTFKWIGKYKYDFYFELNSEQYIIETHGIQHYEQTRRKNAKTIEEEKENDRIKKELALTNGIKEENYIVIDCRYSTLEWIKEHISKKNKLNELFDLSNINWMKAEEFASSNLVKIACEYKRNNPDITAIEIGKLMHMSRSPIGKYLNKGTKLNWCVYNGKGEMGKSAIENNKLKRKPVEIFKNDISQGIFESGMELEKRSEELFGVKIWQTYISAVCNGKIKQYKGFTFKFVA